MTCLIKMHYLFVDIFLELKAVSRKIGRIVSYSLTKHRGNLQETTLNDFLELSFEEQREQEELEER